MGESTGLGLYARPRRAKPVECSARSAIRLGCYPACDRAMHSPCWPQVPNRGSARSLLFLPRLLDPRAGQLMLRCISTPNVFDPGLSHACSRFGRRGVYIGNRQRSQKGQNVWLLQTTIAVEPLLDGAVQVRIAVIFQPTAQPGQVRGVRFSRSAVAVKVLHTVSIKGRALDNAIPIK